MASSSTPLRAPPVATNDPLTDPEEIADLVALAKEGDCPEDEYIDGEEAFRQVLVAHGQPVPW